MKNEIEKIEVLSFIQFMQKIQLCFSDDQTEFLGLDKQFTEEEGYQKRQFANLREKAERAERERDDALRILREVEYSRRNQQAPLIAEDDDSFTIGPDDLAEGKHLSKVQKKIQKLEQQLKNYLQTVR